MRIQKNRSWKGIGSPRSSSPLAGVAPNCGAGALTLRVPGDGQQKGRAYAVSSIKQSLCCGRSHGGVVKLLQLSCWVWLVAGQAVWADDRGASIMFDAAKDQSQLTTPPPEPARDGSGRCAELAARMEALKGRPQQRYAVAQQYEADCQR